MAVEVAPKSQRQGCLNAAFGACLHRNRHRAFMTCEQIHKLSDIPEGWIKAAISLLVLHNLVEVEHIERSNGLGMSHGYRLSSLQTRNHMVETNGRGDIGKP